MRTPRRRVPGWCFSVCARLCVQPLKVRRTCLRSGLVEAVTAHLVAAELEASAKGARGDAEALEDYVAAQTQAFKRYLRSCLGLVGGAKASEGDSSSDAGVFVDLLAAALARPAEAVADKEDGDTGRRVVGLLAQGVYAAAAEETSEFVSALAKFVFNECLVRTQERSAELHDEGWHGRRDWWCVWRCLIAAGGRCERRFCLPRARDSTVALAQRWRTQRGSVAHVAPVAARAEELSVRCRPRRRCGSRRRAFRPYSRSRNCAACSIEPCTPPSNVCCSSVL